MSLFTNKKLWQKLLMIFLVFILFQAVFMKPVHAVDTDILLKPVTRLFVSLADALEGVMQKIILGVNESLLEIKDGSGFWAKFIVIGLFVVGTAIAIVTAIPSGGASVAAWVAFSVTAASTVLLSFGAYSVFGELLTTITGQMLDDTYYLPQYELSPYEIFADKITVLDIDFFNSKPNQIVANGETNTLKEDLSSMAVDSGDTNRGEKRYKVKQKEFDKKYNFDNGPKNNQEQVSKTDHYACSYDLTEKGASSVAGKQQSAYHYTWNDGEIKYDAYVTDQYKEGNTLYRQVLSMKKEVPATQELKSPARELRTYISGWYKTLRNLALVVLLSILVYVGIRIMLSSVASDKAKYKQLLMDWVVAVCLLFLMHYIMAFSVYIVKELTDMILSIQADGSDKDKILNSIGDKLSEDEKENMGAAIDILLLDGTSDSDMKDRVQTAYEVLAESEDTRTRYADFFYQDKNLKNLATEKSNAKVLVWPVSNFMEEARMRYQFNREDGTQNISMYGYGLIYVILVIYTIIFLFTYMKRVVYMAFLTVIAPLVAATYPIDKMNDGKAQAFDTWFKEYIFNLLIQPLHLILYSVLIGSAMSFASENLVYVVMALGFFVPAEKLLRRFFGFEKAQTPGMFGGPAGSALLFSGLNQLMHPRPPIRVPGGKGEKGSTGEIGSGDDEEGKAPRTAKIDETSGFLSDEEGQEPKQFNFDTKDKNDPNAQKYMEAATGQREALLAMQNAPTDSDKKEYSDLYNSYGKDLDRLRNPEYIRWRDNQNKGDLGLAKKPQSLGNVKNVTKINNSRKRRRPLGIGATLRGYRQGMHKRYIAKQKQNGGILRKGIRVAGGIAAATATTAAAGVIGITSGDINKAGQYMMTGAVGGYKLGSSVGNNIVDRAKNQKEMIGNSIKEGKKEHYGKEEYEKREQEKYLKEFKKNEENLKTLQYKLNVDRGQAENIMEEHAPEYVDNGITNMDEFIATYELEHKEGMGRKKAMATRHYAMDRLGGKKVKDLDPETKKKYSAMFNQEFIKAGDSEAQAKQDVSNLYDAIGKFHSYKK